MNNIFKHIRSLFGESVDIVQQRNFIAELESKFKLMVLEIQRSQLLNDILIERQKLATMTGNSNDAIFHKPSETEIGDYIKKQKFRVDKGEDFIKHIGHISTSHIPEGTRSCDWTIQVKEKTPKEGVIEAHEDVGYYIAYVKNKNGELVVANDGRIKKKIVRTPLKLIYHGDNPRYKYFKPTKR